MKSMFIDDDMDDRSPNGREYLTKIQSTEKIKYIPVINSKSADKDKNYRFESLGIPYIIKPSSFEALVNVMRHYIMPLKNHLKAIPVNKGVEHSHYHSW